MRRLRQTRKSSPSTESRKAEEKELLDSVNAILKIQSDDTALPIKHEVKRQLTSRDDVEKFFVERFQKDEAAQKLKRSEIVLKKFGLIPRDFYLEGFMLELLREQVAGYYNADNKTVYLLDWIDPDQQKPVLAHELTHALQDQNFKLEKWSKTGLAGEKKVQDEIQSDEQLAARDAVLEGQAMTAMLDYMLAPTGQSVLTSPLLVKATEIGMTSGGGSPVYDKAPLYLQQALIFPLHIRDGFYGYSAEERRQRKSVRGCVPQSATEYARDHAAGDVPGWREVAADGDSGLQGHTRP